MRKFIFSLLLFILPFLVSLWFLDIFISNFLKKSDLAKGEYEVMNDIYDGNINCDIAIYGSSRAWRHINPLIMEDSLNQTVYNFGIDGLTFRLQYLRHLELIKYNKVPKQIILSVDYRTFGESSGLYNADQFLPYMLWNNNIREYTSSYNTFNIFDYYIPLVRYFNNRHVNKIAYENFNNQNNCNIKSRNKGYKGMDGEWNNDLEKAKADIGLYKIIFDLQAIKLFEKFINECRELNIDLVLVFTPQYIEGQKFVCNQKDFLQVCSYFSNKYNLLFLNYSNDEVCFKRNLFFNSSHLNTKGADLFTSKLASDIKNKKTYQETDSIACPMAK